MYVVTNAAVVVVTVVVVLAVRVVVVVLKLRSLAGQSEPAPMSPNSHVPVMFTEVVTAEVRLTVPKAPLPALWLYSTSLTKATWLSCPSTASVAVPDSTDT